ncbi:hypothetical protein O181_047670 [Austropuccinia psidii MF-1]|uniref:MHD domain-containing protein n=1 Tax=Austropuccinia psidii MF-1 TaxID=1389203 RepID=A0A9Q3HNE6_9BASI|nr:hypothetical protein [Austropuccinia psidii MF-1]
MEGLLILNTDGSLILRSRFATSSAYPLTITDTLVHISRTHQLIPPVIYLPLLSPHAFRSNHNRSSSSSESSDLDYEDIDEDEDEENEHEREKNEGSGHSIQQLNSSQTDSLHSSFAAHESWATPHYVNPLNHNSDAAIVPTLQSSQDDLQVPPLPRLQRGAICCNLIKHNLWLACIASSNMEPSIVFEYLHRFLDFLTNKYLTSGISIGPTTIEANFDLVLQLINLTAPTNEAPYGKNWCESGLIEELVPSKEKSLVKLISQAAESFKSKNQIRLRPSIFASPIPWRPVGLEYTKQEILLDFTESVSVLLNQDGKAIRYEVIGVVDVRSRLSGMPDLILRFVDPKKITRVGFHSCVRQARWDAKQVVSFVPPDGQFRLMSYQSTRSPANFPPVIVCPTVTVGKQGGSFSLLISTVAPLVKLKICWHLGLFSNGILSEQTQCRTRDGRRVEPIWEWDDVKKEICWEINGNDLDCCLTGLWTHRTIENQPSHSIKLEFESKPTSPSLIGLKVDKLEFLNSSFQLNHQSDLFNNSHVNNFSLNIRKGVKMKFKEGKYEIRW